jgi:predicted dehydrogenase
MKPLAEKTSRRAFIKTAATSALAAAGLPAFAAGERPLKKRRVALVGTGIRGVSMWGRDLARDYAEFVEFVGLCDINPGRLEAAKTYIGVDCPTFVNFDEMMRATKPDTLIVTTVDSTHHEFIIKGLDADVDVITEKPMTTDEEKCQAILDAEKRSGKKVTVTFNYRYSPHRQKMYELLRAGEIGDIVSCDFHWYLDIYHGADYFRRWHAYRDKGGTLLVHKSTHHFDLLNWWLETEPAEVFAYGDLEFYGNNNAFRHTHCRPCPHKGQCQFHWKMPERLMRLYADHEKHDGYLRDACVWREDIDIYDKMAAQIRYANNVIVSYSLTTYSPYEGYRIAFNGTRGRLEAWIKERQPWQAEDYDELRLTKNFGDTQLIHIPHAQGGHGGGDMRMLDKIFKDPDAPDPYRQSAGPRDGAMSILAGIAARKSIEQQRPVKIEELTSLKPMALRP